MAGTEEETDNAWWTKPTFIISAIAVVLLIGTGIILFAFLGNNEETEAASPAQPQTSAPTSTAAEPVSGESVCGLKATGGTTLTSAPNVEWEFLGGIAAPKSAEHGPGVVDEQTGVRSCYSNTPEGALLAVTGMLAASGDTELLIETTRALVLEGPGKERTIASLKDRLDSGNTSSVPIEVAGFRLLSYSSERATVEVVLSADSSEGEIYHTTASDIVWDDGDWYFTLNADGSGGPIDGQIKDLSGYIPWGPTDG